MRSTDRTDAWNPAMNCPACGTEFDGISDLIIMQNGEVPWYQPQPRKRFKCPECGVGLRLRTLLVAAIIAGLFLLIGILSAAYPDSEIYPVLFVVALIALTVAVPASLKSKARLERDDSIQPE